MTDEHRAPAARRELVLVALGVAAAVFVIVAYGIVTVVRTVAPTRVPGPSPEKLASIIRAHHLGCDRLEAFDPTDDDFSNSVDEVWCAARPATIVIASFRHTDAPARAMRGLCAASESSNPAYVLGAHWLVWPGDTASAAKIHAVVGGVVRHACS